MTLRISQLVVATSLLLIAACGGGSDAGGNVTRGPLGQQPLLTGDVQIAFRAGISACADFEASNASIATLSNQGFSPTRNGFGKSIDNPNILVGGSRVSVSISRGECTVNASPAFPVEINTVRNLTREVLTSKNLNLNSSLRSGTRSGVGFVQVIF
jgi:hypothetical protein